jgi:hypothetical protein
MGTSWGTSFSAYASKYRVREGPSQNPCSASMNEFRDIELPKVLGAVV